MYHTRKTHETVFLCSKHNKVLNTTNYMYKENSPNSVTMLLCSKHNYRTPMHTQPIHAAKSRWQDSHEKAAKVKKCQTMSTAENRDSTTNKHTS
jgi:hypothetical protein